MLYRCIFIIDIFFACPSCSGTMYIKRETHTPHKMAVAFDNSVHAGQRTIFSPDEPFVNSSQSGILHSAVFVVAEDGSVVVKPETAVTLPVLEALAAMPPVVMIDSGRNFYVAVCEDGSLWTWSQNGSDDVDLLCRLVYHDKPQRGDRPYHVPKDVPGIVHRNVFDGEHVVQVSCGQTSMMVLTREGNVWVVYSQCHHRIHAIRSSPASQSFALQMRRHKVNNESIRSFKEYEAKVSFAGHKMRMVANSYNSQNPSRFYNPPNKSTSHTTHFAALCENGGVWTWGGNYWGQLGFFDAENPFCNTRNPKQIPHSVFGGSAIAMIAVGDYNTAVVTMAGALWLWGRRYECIPPQTTQYNSCMRVPTPVSASDLGDGVVRTVACGERHVLAVTKDGSLWTLQGYMHEHEANSLNTILTGKWRPIPQHHFGGAKIVSCFANARSSAAVTENGTLYVWGAIVNTNTPTVVPTTCRVGRWHDIIAPSRAMAIAQATNNRLGQLTLGLSDIPSEIIRKICQCHGPGVHYAAGKLSGASAQQ